MAEWFEQPELIALASEKSIRGRVVHEALARAAEADDKESELLAEALQELLSRFQAAASDRASDDHSQS